MNSRLYIIVYGTGVNAEKLKNKIEANPSISFWFLNMDNSIFVRSVLSAQQLYNYLEPVIGQSRIFITPIERSDYFGRLPQEHWQYFP